MKAVQLTVNGQAVYESVEARTHLADFLRERLNLTATHVRCEQGACGACTLLIDGQPARSCITYAVMCDGAVITTLEGLEEDVIMAALRRAFSAEHALQCGYCTPGMLVTARDIIMRLPDADHGRVRAELSGNLCRCTGYVGVVRAIVRVLNERRKGELPATVNQQGALGPVGARPAHLMESRTIGSAAEIPTEAEDRAPSGEIMFGLQKRRPNVEIRQSFTLSRKPDEVWAFLADIPNVVPCLPGASLMRPPAGERVYGRMVVKIGPITANFVGQARIMRDATRRRGVISGTGQDRAGLSRASGEVEYILEPEASGGTRVALTVRALLTGPLAQFGRSTIVEDMLAKITETFARNLEIHLSGEAAVKTTLQAPLDVGPLLRRSILTRLTAFLGGLFKVPKA
jgi:aerobic carbon-monoxide dehydrogenase small subunit